MYKVYLQHKPYKIFLEVIRLGNFPFFSVIARFICKFPKHHFLCNFKMLGFNIAKKKNEPKMLRMFEYWYKNNYELNLEVSLNIPTNLVEASKTNRDYRGQDKALERKKFYWSLAFSRLLQNKLFWWNSCRAKRQFFFYFVLLNFRQWICMGLFFF